jgi:ankyrin repeat protein
LVKKLLDWKEADVNARDKGSDGRTALHWAYWAVLSGSLAEAGLLVATGARVNTAIDMPQGGAAMTAALHNDPSLLQFLVEAGVDLRPGSRMSSLMIAASRGTGRR